MEAPSGLRSTSPLRSNVGTLGDDAAPLQDAVERIDQLRPNLVSKPAASEHLNAHAINTPVVGSGATTLSFWIALLAGEFKEGETLYIEYSGEKNVVPCILPGQYRLADLIREQDYLEVYLEHPTTQTKFYCLKGYFQNGAIREIQLKRDEDNTLIVPADLFERSYLASKGKTYPHIPFSSAPKQALTTATETTLKVERRINLEEIRKQFDAICAELIQNLPLLNDLLESLVKNNLEAIDFEILVKSHPKLVQAFKNLARAYFHDLEEERTLKRILLKAVLEANYAICIGKTNNLVVTQTMELLYEANLHIERMRGKEVVLFMGNEGAGKSATVGFFMGARIKEFVNVLGENDIRLEKDRDASIYPEIGSASPFTQGFEVPSSDALLVDCPALNTPSGDAHDLCAKFSIDKTIELVKCIRSLVVVVPASAFILDKGNPILEVLSTVQERFPGAFKAKGAADNPRVYLLVTKSNQLSYSSLKILYDGTLTDARVRETETQLKNLIARGTDLDSLETQVVQRRLDLWKAVQQLLQNQQVHRLDTQNMRLRRDLLALYTKKHTEQKGPYQKAMTGDYLQRKFRECLQMVAHTWSHCILGQYLDTLPKSISEQERELRQTRERLNRLDEEKKDRFSRTHSLSTKINELEQMQKALKDYQKSDMREEAMKLVPRIPLEIDELKKEKVRAENVSDLEEKMQKAREEINRVTANLKSLHQQMRNLAIVIATNWDHAKHLRDFCHTVLDPVYTLDSQQPPYYKNFIRLFDQNKDTLLTKIKTEYGF